MNIYAQSIADAFSQTVKTSKRKPNLLETDDAKEYVNKVLNDLSKTNIIKRNFRNTAEGAVFAERFNRTICKLVKKPVFGKENAGWLSELPSVIKKCNNTIHHSKMTPIQASKEKNEKLVFSNLQDKRQKSSISVRTIS